ncbi:unnamed protein product [Arctogadus glacialis]
MAAILRLDDLPDDPPHPRKPNTDTYGDDSIECMSYIRDVGMFRATFRLLFSHLKKPRLVSRDLVSRRLVSRRLVSRGLVSGGVVSGGIVSGGVVSGGVVSAASSPAASSPFASAPAA